MVDDFFKIIKLLSLHYVIFCHGSCFGTILVALISAVMGKKKIKKTNKFEKKFNAIKNLCKLQAKTVRHTVSAKWFIEIFIQMDCIFTEMY